MPGAPKRKLRNYLLDRRFQLKYTGMVVGVTMIVASILGALAYHESKGQTEALQIQLATQPDLDPTVSAGLEAFGAERDREILLSIILGVAALTVALGMTGIVITHKVVGPAYKMRMLFSNVAKGHLRVDGGLRKGDELQEVFNTFHDMVQQLRARRESDIEELDRAIETASGPGRSDDVVRILSDVKARMRQELD